MIMKYLNTNVVCNYCGDEFLSRIFDNHCSLSCKKKNWGIRLISKIKVVNDCWVWTGAKSMGNYGIIIMDNKRKQAHRKSYELFKGEIPDNMSVCHKCDNPICINPDHLFLGTHKDNAIDRCLKDRGNKKLNNEKVLEIRKMSKEGFSNVYIAKKFGISIGNTCGIITRRHWKHI